MMPMHVCFLSTAVAATLEEKVNQNTAVSHRKIANVRLLCCGLSGSFPCGPLETESLAVRAHHQALVETSLVEDVAGVLRT